MRPSLVGIYLESLGRSFDSRPGENFTFGLPSWFQNDKTLGVTVPPLSSVKMFKKGI